MLSSRDKQESLTGTPGSLRAQTRYYESHVLAWYALGRVTEARSARAMIARRGRRAAASDDVV